MISFIIPAYNAEATLSRAVSSILEEKRAALELLLFDDGSTDGTPALCDAFAAQDSRVRVFHTENQGHGIARNIGIENAMGEWLFFCDADDYVLWDGIHVLLARAAAGSYDIICGLYYRIEGGKKERIGKTLQSGAVSRSGNKQEKKLYHRIKTESLFGYSVCKLYKRRFLTENELNFPDVRKVYMEDTLFNLMAFSKHPAYYLENVPTYCYVISNQSFSRRRDAYIAEKSAMHLSVYGSYLQKQGLWEENLDLYVPLAMRLICWALLKSSPGGKADAARMHRTLGIFFRVPQLREILSDRKNLRELWKLPSLPQRMFYSFVFLFLPWRKGALVVRIFICGYPLLQRYAKHVLS